MSERHVPLVWQHFPRGGAKLAVLLAIAEAYNPAGTYVSMAELASAARISKSAVEKSVRWLRDERWIVAAPILGRGNFLAYALNLPKLQRSARPGCDPDPPQSDAVRAARNTRERRSRKYGTPSD